MSFVVHVARFLSYLQLCVARQANVSPTLLDRALSFVPFKAWRLGSNHDDGVRETALRGTSLKSNISQADRLRLSKLERHRAALRHCVACAARPRKL